MNGKLQDISVAIGLRQLAGLDRRLASRREVFGHYRIKFTGAGMRFQPNAKASALGFESAYSTNSEVVGFADLPVTEDICSRIVSLPIHDDVASDDVGRVVAAVGEGGPRID